MARLWVLCASKAQRREIDKLFAASLAALWRPQPQQPNTFQLVATVTTEASQCAAALAQIAVPFEIEAPGERFLYHPGLGIKRQQLDEAGEVVFRAGFLKQQLLESGGNAAEFERRLRLAEGQAWLDILEPYRLALLRYDAMPRAV